jgi:deazaflavin-dependent oxidoreductase (nitroreductase family)
MAIEEVHDAMPGRELAIFRRPRSVTARRLRDDADRFVFVNREPPSTVVFVVGITQATGALAFDFGPGRERPMGDSLRMRVRSAGSGGVGLAQPSHARRTRPVSNSMQTDPAERSPFMRLFYRGWRPTRLGRMANRFAAWWSGLGLPPKIQAALEVQGRASGKTRTIPVVIASVDGKSYLVSMLGPQSEWVKNVEATGGRAVIRQGRRRSVRLVPVPSAERAPILREYVRIAASGRTHFPLPVGAPLPEFEAIAERYPAYRIEPA